MRFRLPHFYTKAFILSGLIIANTTAPLYADDDSPFVMEAGPSGIASCSLLLTSLGGDTNSVIAPPSQQDSLPVRVISRLGNSLVNPATRLGVVLRQFGENVSVRTDGEQNEPERLLNSSQVIFVKVFPDLIKDLRDRLPADRVNILLNIGRRIFIRELEAELSDSASESIQSAMMDFSSIRMTIESDQKIDIDVLERALQSAKNKFNEFISARLPNIYNQLMELKKSDNLHWFGIGIGDHSSSHRNEHLAKISSQYSRLTGDPNKTLLWSEVRSSVANEMISIRDLIPRLRNILRSTPELGSILLDEDGNFSDQFLKILRSYESESDIQESIKDLENDIGILKLFAVSKMMSQLSRFISLVAKPAQYDGLAEGIFREKMDLPNEADFLLSFDIEGAGASMSRELIQILEDIISERSNEEIHSKLEALLTQLDPRQAREHMFKRIEEVFNVVSSHGLTPFWQTGDEITFAFNDENTANDVKKIVDDVFRRNQLGSIRASLIHLRTNGNNSRVQSESSAVLVDYAEIVQKEIKRLFYETYHEKAPSFYIELEVPSVGNELVATIHTYNDQDTKTLKMFSWLYKKQILDRIETEHPLYDWTSSTQLSVSQQHL